MGHVSAEIYYFSGNLTSSVFFLIAGDITHSFGISRSANQIFEPKKLDIWIKEIILKMQLQFLGP
jgi:hypothetical protein